MPRNIGPCPQPPTIESDPARHIDGHFPGLETWEQTIRVITPIFGGGVTPRETDPITVVRPAAIRGHLRFWWRAMRGGQHGDGKTLREKEKEIWGSIEEPSAVQVEVRVTKEGRLEPCATFPPDRSFPRFEAGYPAYALFPFQGSKKDKEAPAWARRGVEFRLCVRFPANIRYEVFGALWGWMNFGGIGARTRRGCGALACQAFAPAGLRQLGGWWNATQTHIHGPNAGVVPEWPTVQGAPLVGSSATTPGAAWEAAVGALREFRQGEGVGRNRGMQPSRPGRSRWPEADSLRRITNSGDPRHRPGVTSQSEAFPRAELGLPIVFHFKDYQDAANNSELYPRLQSGSRRMASPVILKPLAFADGQAAPMALFLRAPGPDGLMLHFNESKQEQPVTGIVRGAELAGYTNSPMAKRSSHGSALEAFRAFLKEKGWREVGRP
jgi:CRISPR-associated protein Cmr1